MEVNTKLTVRPFQLAHQVLKLNSINFETKTIHGFTELTIVPTKDSLRLIRLNAKQCRILNITLNDVCSTEFVYFDPFKNISQDYVISKTLEDFSEYHINAAQITDPDDNAGEVTIIVPPMGYSSVQEGRGLRIAIEFILQNPVGGLHFVVPPPDTPEEDKAPHMFSYSYENSSRLWFPCIDSFADPCTWEVQITVDAKLTAVSCGELVDVKISNDKTNKTYFYALNVPVCAPNIAVAVGKFDIYEEPRIADVTNFCLPGLVPLVKNTIRYLPDAFEFYEEVLSTNYPFSCYKQVFVDELDTDIAAYATMSIVSVRLLHSIAIIDQVYPTRRLLSRAIAEQFFGCFINSHRWSDTWLAKGIAEYLCGLHSRKCFGTSEYLTWIQNELKLVVKYEEKYGGIILDCSQPPAPLPVSAQSSSAKNKYEQEILHYFPINSLHTVSPKYVEAMRIKAHLVIRMLEHRIGDQLLIKVFNKQLTLAVSAAKSKIGSQLWPQLLISTNIFIRAIFTVTGKDMSVFMDQWVRTGGHAKFSLSSIFNRKRNTIELEIRQDHVNKLGVRKYNGPLLVQLQELDGTFSHMLQIENIVVKADITCHSKSRRNKKKKIPLCTGEEVEMDLTAMSDSPVLWIRLDPDMILLRHLDIEQPDFQWQFQLRHERDVTAQFEAICALEKYPSNSTRQALNDTIENERVYYKVRCAAAHCLTEVANQMATQWNGPPAMLNIFRKLFGSYRTPHITKLNDFSKLQLYFLQKTIPVAMAGLRTSHGICPPEVFRFLLDLFKYNENQRNHYSDVYFKAALIEALGLSITPVVSVALRGSVIKAESLSADAKMVLEEITKRLNLEKKLPSYKFLVSVACLKVLRKLQKCGHLPPLAHIYRSYAVYGLYTDLRIAALECLVDFVKVDGKWEDFDHLLNILENDPDRSVRHALAQLLIDNPPFTKSNKESRSPLNRIELVERLWENMNNKLAFDTKLRCDMVDLYYALYGKRTPLCVQAIEATDIRKEIIQMANSSGSFKDSSESEQLKTSSQESGKHKHPLPPRKLNEAKSLASRNDTENVKESWKDDEKQKQQSNKHVYSTKNKTKSEPRGRSPTTEKSPHRKAEKERKTKDDNNAKKIKSDDRKPIKSTERSSHASRKRTAAEAFDDRSKKHRSDKEQSHSEKSKYRQKSKEISSKSNNYAKKIKCSQIKTATTNRHRYKPVYHSSYDNRDEPKTKRYQRDRTPESTIDMYAPDNKSNEQRISDQSSQTIYENSSPTDLSDSVIIKKKKKKDKKKHKHKHKHKRSSKEKFHKKSNDSFINLSDREEVLSGGNDDPYVSYESRDTKRRRHKSHHKRAKDDSFSPSSSNSESYYGDSSPRGLSLSSTQ